MRPIFHVEAPEMSAPALGGDLRLFTITFAAGFLFVSVFLA